MGSSEGGDAEGCGVGDCSPGTIVWVRRRNGSWWPGRILGPDELPASQIMSPRSGTPVKLLGREDASVDWYNLEKSKRVKAFRCGEFDACIERAEASQGTPIKKREKYARREDAILHALELERKQFALKYQNQGFRCNDISSKPSGDMRREFNDFSEFYARNDMHEPQGKYNGRKQLPSQYMPCTQQRKDLSNTDQRYKSKKSKKQKEDTFDAGHQTRVPQQYFLHAGSKRNFSESVAWETSENPDINHVDDFSLAKHVQGAISVDSGGKNTAVKKKRTEGSVFEESLVKKRDRRRPLVQVLQSSAKMQHPSMLDTDSGAISVVGEKDPMPITYRAKRTQCMYLPADSGDTQSHADVPLIQMASTGADFETESYLQQPAFSEEHTSSDWIERTRSDGSERECSETRDCSETETEDEIEHLQGANQILPPEPERDACDPYSLRDFEKFRNVENGDEAVALSTYMPHLNDFEDEDGSSELGVSKWHMKGKRNSRNVAKRPMDMGDGNPWVDKPNGFMKGSLHRRDESNPKKESMETSSQRSFGRGFYQTKEELYYDSDETDIIDKDASHSEVTRYYAKKYPSSLKATRDLGRSYTSFNDSENDSCKISPLNREADQISRIGRKPHWQGSSCYQRNYVSRLGEMGPMLIDVDIKVQASYQGEHVPLVSLMSRLNGKAIVGHPIQIEILEDGLTDQFVSGGAVSLDDSPAAPPVWRTGRRTAMQRVPRSNPARATLEGDDEGGLLYSEWEMKSPLKNCSAPSNHQVRLVKKSISNARRPSSSKFQKKPSKKGSLSSQKTRTLSSISTGKKHSGEGSQAKAYRRSDIFGGLIEPDRTVPLVTCVPMKVVFSRILEAVGRPPLAVAHRVRMASPAVRGDPP